MQIKSAQYIDDAAGDHTGVMISYLDDAGDAQQAQVPFEGVTWQNQALEAWVQGGGTIAAAAPV